MDLFGKWASLGRPSPVGPAICCANAATECHSGKAASHQLLKVGNLLGATWPCTVAPACLQDPGRTCTYLMRGELAGAATMPQAVSDATEVPFRLVHSQMAPRLAFTSEVDSATPQVSDWPHSWAPAPLVRACSAPPHASAAHVTQRFPGSEPAASDTSSGALVALLRSTPLPSGRPRRNILVSYVCAPFCSMSACAGGATDSVDIAQSDPKC